MIPDDSAATRDYVRCHVREVIRLVHSLAPRLARKQTPELIYESMLETAPEGEHEASVVLWMMENREETIRVIACELGVN